MTTKAKGSKKAALMTTIEAAKYAGTTPKYLNDLRVRPTKGAGCPKFKRDGRNIFYAKKDLDAWNEKRAA